jgi:hypothetical protein
VHVNDTRLVPAPHQQSVEVFLTVAAGGKLRSLISGPFYLLPFLRIDRRLLPLA